MAKDFWFVGENFEFRAFGETLMKEVIGYSIEGILYLDGKEYGGVLFFTPDDANNEVWIYWNIEIEGCDIQIEGEKLAVLERRNF